MFKYMSADVAPLFAKSLRVRFTQPFDLNDPLRLTGYRTVGGIGPQVRYAQLTASGCPSLAGFLLCRLFGFRSAGLNEGFVGGILAG